MRRVVVVLLVAVLSGVLFAPPSGVGVRWVASAEEPAWAPGPALYDVAVTSDVPVTMPDGRVLRANLARPTLKGTTTPAEGPFPVILVQTPYGKSVSGTGLGELPPYLVERGYIGAVVDVAGTGGSEGQSMLFGRQEAEDGAELVRWAAALPGSTGEVGTLGGSYLGIDQLFTAAEVGPDSPLKAIFPIASAADPFRDLFVSGGIVNMESGLGLIAAYFGLRTFTPMVERSSDPLDALRLMVEHGFAGIPFELQTGMDALFQQGRVYDSDYWRERAPINVLQQIADNGVPAYLVGGQWDVFQRGEPLLYSGLQNAYAGRPVTAPMVPGQPVTSRYQLLTGPWDHGNQGAGIDLFALELQWFDHWLKGIDTGITDTSTPLHVIEPGGAAYDIANYPSEQASTQRLHLQPGKGLATSKPTAATGSDPMLFTGVSAACQRSVSQWSAGGLRDWYEACKQVPSLSLVPGEQAWTTAPLGADLRLAGPIGLTVNVSSTRPETMFVAELQSVAPDGRVTDLTGGAQLGSMRAVDPERSWPSGDGGWMLPYHPLTEESAQAVPVGAVTRYDIEIRPAFLTVPAGHRLRVMLRTGDAPHLLPPPMKLDDLLLGIYNVQRNATTPSWIDLQVAD
jgi:putative CocE/NonD family hydrolase